MDLKQYSSGETTEWLKKATKKRQHIFMAIFLSNSKLIQQIADSDPEGIKNDDIYLIMEDDSVVLDDFDKKLKKLLDNTPADWQVLRLGYWGRVRCEDRVNQYALSIQYPSVDHKAIGDDHFYSGNQGYLVRGSAIPEIISILKEQKIGAIENAFMYPSTEGKQIISYGVAPDFKLLGLTHEGIEGASRKGDSLLQRSRLSEANQPIQFTQKFSEQATESYQGGRHNAEAAAHKRSHPRLYNNITECIDTKVGSPRFSEKMATYSGTKKFFYINVKENDKGDRSENMKALFKAHNHQLPALKVQGVTKDDIQKGHVDISQFSNGHIAEYMQDYNQHKRLVTTAIWMSHA